MTTALQALTQTTGNRTDKWNTPTDFVGDVVKFFGTIDLDPCCNSKDNPNVPANNYYDESEYLRNWDEFQNLIIGK